MIETSNLCQLNHAGLAACVASRHSLPSSSKNKIQCLLLVSVSSGDYIRSKMRLSRNSVARIPPGNRSAAFRPLQVPSLQVLPNLKPPEERAPKHWLIGRIGALAILVALTFTQPFAAELQESPLAPPLPSQSPTLFELLSAESTGVDLVHQFPPNPTVDTLQDQRSGAGVCVGDFDLDGWPDVFVTHYDRGNRLYRNRGDWRFEDVTEPAGVGGQGRWCGGASFVDIDNDGDLDLYVCAFNAPNLLYINQGNGKFLEQAEPFGLDVSGASVMATFGDYDRDGWLDVYLVTARLSFGAAERLPKNSKEALQRGAIRLMPGGKISIGPAYRELFDTLSKGPGRSELIIAGQFDRLYKNRSGTNFVDVTASAGISGNHIGLAALWWDFNNDQYPDLYVSNDYKGPDQLLRNNGNGTFTDVTRSLLPCVPWSSMGADIADLNLDGWIDLLATDMAGSTHARRVLNYSDPEKDLWFMLAADPQQYRRNTLFLNSGASRFLEIARLAGVDSTDWTWSPKFGDLDNDGWTDLFISNGMSRDFINRDYLAAEERGGNWIDTPILREKNFAFRNLDGLRFANMSAPWGLDQRTASYGAALSDLDRDGDLDLVLCNFEAPLAILRNTSRARQSVLVRLEGRKSNRWGLGATVTVKTAGRSQTQYLTLARGFMSANEPILHFGLGTHSQIDELLVRWPSGINQRLNNLDAGKLYTVVEPAQSNFQSDYAELKPQFRPSTQLAEAHHHERDFDDYERQPLLPFKLSHQGPGMAWGDVDRDGDDDLFVGGAAGQPGQLMLQSSPGVFVHKSQPAFDADRESEDMAAIFFEANGDGALDLFVASGGVEADLGAPAYRDRLYMNDGSGSFRKAPDGMIPDDRDSGSVAAAADFDRDGDLDLFIGGRSVPGRYPLAPASRLLKNERGKFIDATPHAAPALQQAGMVTSGLWSDINNDGWIDLLITQDWGPVRLLINQQGRLEEQTQESGLAQWSGRWTGITGRDLNGDGRIDYVVTNFGLNSPYRATPQHPSVLLAGDFENRGAWILIEAEYEGDKLYPVRGRSTLTQAMPLLLEKYTSFQSFAEATVEAILGPDRLSDSLRLEVNTLQSGVLINSDHGVFKFQPLPPLAQAAPTFGVALAEFNGDLYPDLCLAQNFSHAQPEIGRLNGGLSLFLRGNGDGTFEPLPPQSSGLRIPGDARSLTIANLNGDEWPDLVFGMNNGPVATFESLPSSKLRMATISLTAGVWNSTAIGTRVSFTLSDGSTQTAELSGGGGYLSQNPGLLHFGLGQSNQVQEINIRWPDGRVETVRPPPGQTQFRFTVPPAIDKTSGSN